LSGVFILLLHGVAALGGAGHALVYKRDPRSALGWIGMCLVFPLIGPLLYFLFGINRVRTRAQRLSRRSPLRLDIGNERGNRDRAVSALGTGALSPLAQTLARVAGPLARRPLIEGNQVAPLHHGEAAYPAMLEAIEGATSHVLLTTYLFETNATGRRFIDALVRAVERGVSVRVLIDGVGEFYNRPWAGRLLEQGGVRVARFMRPRLLPPVLDFNLRNHRKILVADGRTAFIGGMNIGDRHRLDRPGVGHPVVDLHFAVSGPIVQQIETVFAEDWHFTTGEVLALTWPSAYPAAGAAVCRAITDGPNDEMDTLSLVLHGVVSVAHERIDIMTPYFIPPDALVAALQSAALRGVRVRVLLPGRNNLPYVHWATRNLLGELLAYGVEVAYQPGPFVHTKLFVVDGHYAVIGSANLDTRSLRLNFELAVEIFCPETVAGLHRHCDGAAAQARPVTLSEIDGRSLPVRVRDSACWLFSPYL